MTYCCWVSAGSQVAASTARCAPMPADAYTSGVAATAAAAAVGAPDAMCVSVCRRHHTETHCLPLLQNDAEGRQHTLVHEGGLATAKHHWGLSTVPVCTAQVLQHAGLSTRSTRYARWAARPK
jgi:hypothetical protein